MTKHELDIKLLKESITKWKFNTQQRYRDNMKISACECPLCHKYTHSRCKGCPIKIYTGIILCKNTPYEDVLKCSNTGKKLKETVSNEVTFLQTVLKWYKKRPKCRKNV